MVAPASAVPAIVILSAFMVCAGVLIAGISGTLLSIITSSPVDGAPSLPAASVA